MKLELTAEVIEVIEFSFSIAIGLRYNLYYMVFFVYWC